MKITVDGKDLYSLNATQLKVLADDISDDILDSDLKRRLQWVLMHKYTKCFDALQKQWLPRLRERCEMVPTDPDKFAEVVFSQPDYKSKKRRDSEKPS